MQMLQRYAVAGWLGTKGRFSESGAAAAAVLLQRGAGNGSLWFTGKWNVNGFTVMPLTIIVIIDMFTHVG